MTTVTIPLSKSILEQIKGKTIKESSLTENGELKLKIEDCHFWERTSKIKQEIDEGKKVEIDVDKLEKHFL
ncbi:MAG: hypothetical protein FWH29_08995 [Methanobrevibacter sp.]|nr:hypothetical protein [Methanobrevibacter sp.]